MPSAGAKAAFAEVSLSIMTSAKPFGIDMDFTTTVGYSYSQTSEETTTLKYDFDLVRSDPGYIVMVNAQVSVRTRSGPIFSEVGHHEAVILKNRTPRSYVAFTYRS
ncbi:MAG: hypothetical protein BYD32DRAFT_463365 [Podila humilis]|nr:MAG: hypothetical protein BYD32DRAFT_463365 [Podila humilis]